MAFNNKIHAVENSRVSGFGIGPHDFMRNTYNAGGLITKTEYFRGGSQATGENVGVLEFSYDAGNNIISVERTS